VAINLLVKVEKEKDKKKVWDFGDIPQSDFEKLSRFIYKTSGIHISEKKRYLLQNRLVKRLKELNFDNYTDYTNYVLKDKNSKDEVIQMMNVISTNKTDFFREQEHFDFLFKQVSEHYKEENISVWSAGCSTGQEVYSICMILEELLEKNKISDYKVWGNDISTSVLEKARLAIYPFREAENIPDKFRKKYVLKSKSYKDQKIRIISTLREKSRFFWMNLIDDEFGISGNFNFIFCRNTLIYFDKYYQEKIVSNLTKYLKKGGYLFIGHSESLINIKTSELKYVLPAVYQKM